MKLQLLHRLIYLDRDFITGAYEEIKGEAPTTQITKHEGMTAGAKVLLFSAGVSAVETKTFAVSSLGMLRALMPDLELAPNLSSKSMSQKSSSAIGWITGHLTIFKVEVTRQGKEHNQLPKTSERRTLPSPYKQTVASETYFAIHNQDGLKLALVTTADYFSSGLNTLTSLYETVLCETSIPVRALVKVISSRSTFDEWIGIPMVILEQSNEG